MTNAQYAQCVTAGAARRHSRTYVPHPLVLLQQPDLRQLSGDLGRAGTRPTPTAGGPASGCPPKRNGRRRPRGERYPCLPVGRPSAELLAGEFLARSAMPGRHRRGRQLPGRGQLHTGCWTWQATCGSGSTTGTSSSYYSVSPVQQPARAKRRGPTGMLRGGRLGLLRQVGYDLLRAVGRWYYRHPCHLVRRHRFSVCCGPRRVICWTWGGHVPGIPQVAGRSHQSTRTPQCSLLICMISPPACRLYLGP